VWGDVVQRAADVWLALLLHRKREREVIIRTRHRSAHWLAPLAQEQKLRAGWCWESGRVLLVGKNNAGWRVDILGRSGTL